MQIRVANRQDEPLIRAIANQVNAELGLGEVELTGRDADLNNVEAHYFWYDGLFVVAEEEGQIIGFAGGLRADADNRMVLERLAVIAARRQRGVGRTLMETVVFFAQNMGYDEIIFDPQKHGAVQKTPCLGFVVAEKGLWRFCVPAAVSLS